MSVVMFPTPFLDAFATWDSTQPNEVFLRNHEAAQDQEAADHEAVSPDTVSRLLNLLDERGVDDYGIVDPTQHAFKSVCTLIMSAQKLMVGGQDVAGSPSVDSRGGIRVTWRRADREVRLVCPPSQTEQVYIYQESDSRNQAIHAVTPEVLAEKLSWLVSGGDIL